MKLAVIGGGGVRSMFLAKSIAQRSADLGITELVFMDTDEEKLRIFGGMAGYVTAKLSPELHFSTTLDPVEAISGASYVITTIRVGGDLARTVDEHLALSEGVLGQETTGAAGFSFAMRSIPVLCDYCELVKKYAKPGAKVFNFTNPVGIVSQALQDKGYDFTYGICDAPSSMIYQIADAIDADPGRLDGELFGLNHLSWFHNISLDGKDIMKELLVNPKVHRESDMRLFDEELLSMIGCVPNEYLYYFYYSDQALKNILKTGHTRGDDILEINTGMIRELRNLDPVKDFEKCLEIYTKWYRIRENRYMATETGTKREKEWTFDLFSPDAGGYAGVALKYIEIENSHKKGSMIICVPNQGSVDFLMNTDTVEVSCDIIGGKAIPHRFADIPEAQKELIRRVKYYERVGSRAILNRSRKDAIESLMLHPLVNSYDIASRLTDRFIDANKEWTGKWGD